MLRVDLRPRDITALRAALRRFSFVRSARVFGSRATGTARRGSDLDLAIRAPEATAAQWRDLCDALENAPLIYELDIVREEGPLDPRLSERIRREGITIYPEEEE